jgi:phospholipase/carboxylesterase
MRSGTGTRAAPTIERFGAAEDPASSLAVLAVHGRSQTPAFVRGIEARLDDPDTAWFAPAAPDDTWYPQSFLVPVADNQPDLDDSLTGMRTSLALIRQAGWSTERTVVLGFSQGACLLSQLLLTAPAPLCAGAVLLTGGFVGPPGTPPPDGTAWTGRPVFCGLVENDPWVPLSRARHTADVLRDRGADVELRVYPGDVHEVNDDEIAATARLLDTVRRGL